MNHQNIGASFPTPSSSLSGEDRLIAPSEREGQAIGLLLQILGFIRRQWLKIAFFVALALALAIVYLVTTPPWYTATSELLLDTRRIQVLQQQSVISDLSFDAAVVESQLEILKSEALALGIVNKFDLTNDPEFTNGVPSLMGSVRSAITSVVNWWTGEVPEPSPPEVITQRAIDYLGYNLSVQRVGRSNVIEISFQSRDPGKAVLITNAFGEAYISDELDAKYAATKRAADWLKDRTDELRQQAESADRAALEFRNKHSLAEADGKLLTDQQLSEINTQLTTAKAQTAEAKARLDRIREISKHGIEDAAVGDSLQNAVLIRLQQQYIDAAKREADFSARYGSDHVAAVNLRKEMQQIQDVSKAEMNRIAESYKSDYEIARSREQSLQASLDRLTADSAGTREAQVGLRLLESSADAYRTLHNNFLEKFVEANQQQSLPSTEARVIATAMVAKQTYPRVVLVLAVASLLGAGVGCTVAFAREGLDRALRTTRQVETILGLECLGVIPATTKRASQSKPSQDNLPQTGVRALTDDFGVARQVILAPFSRFAETIRSIKVSADTSTTMRGIKVIGMTSALPGEGKTTVASSLAQVLAHGGRRTLLIDADLRNPALTRHIAPQAQRGMLEVINGTAELRDVVWRDPVTGLDFLPTVLEVPLAHTNEIVGSVKMTGLLATARDQYEYVIIDFPPIAPVVDAKAAAHHMDAFVLVIEWGKTLPEAIFEALWAAEMVHSKMLGAVLNKANATAIRKLERYKGGSYHSYYQSDAL